MPLLCAVMYTTKCTKYLFIFFKSNHTRISTRCERRTLCVVQCCGIYVPGGIGFLRRSSWKSIPFTRSVSRYPLPAYYRLRVYLPLSDFIRITHTPLVSHMSLVTRFDGHSSVHLQFSAQNSRGFQNNDTTGG